MIRFFRKVGNFAETLSAGDTLTIVIVGCVFCCFIAALGCLVEFFSWLFTAVPDSEKFGFTK